MKKNKIKLIAVLFMLLSFNTNNKKDSIQTLLGSENATDLIEAYSYINKIDDTIYIEEMFKNPYDARVSNDLRFKGISVYQAKMNAFKRMSGIEPPHIINYKVDTVNVHFYLNWASSKSYISRDLPPLNDR